MPTVGAGIVTHYPVIVVADDGKPYRIGTWANSVEAALAPFLERFPHAKGLEGERFSAPDDTFAVRLKMVGLMLGALVVGLIAAVLISLPYALSRKSALDAANARQTARMPSRPLHSKTSAAPRSARRGARARSIRSSQPSRCSSMARR